MNFDKLIAIFDADWDESKHPRAKNGQFGKGNGGSSAPAKENKKSTMSKSYKALSPGQKADAKANVASQIKSMSKEKQISVANRVLKAQGKEPIVANKDGTYTWTNKGERVTTQKPPRIKSDKLARAHEEGRNVRRSDLYQVTELIRGGLRSTAPNTSSLNRIVGMIRLSPKVGARYGDIANEILKDLHDIHK